MFTVNNDIMKVGFSNVLKEIERLEQAVLLANIQVADIIAKDGIEIVIHNANTMITHEESLDEKEFATDWNVAKVKKVGLVTEVEIKNESQRATYLEYGTGIVGEFSPHPNPNSYNGGWEYFVDSPQKRINSAGEMGWYYSNEYRQRQWTSGIPSQPFYYQSAKDIKKMLPTWYRKLIRKNMRGGLK